MQNDCKYPDFTWEEVVRSMAMCIHGHCLIMDKDLPEYPIYQTIFQLLNFILNGLS